ncbi:hypothetical protein CQ12_25255 [Bradyrhizobium jicamae]|uniref:Uncharacterized protein n=1 Tax=Bradyrhizobium jicamae TaxID=280332 RepID=A0A0R3LJH9_9BRAD|nr:hypothetical protein [Bradyrhizobium jicamae]KRR07911.1 hypothetical protein CQ12_25255 [Bradyrhizobium jicamae]
MTKPFLATALCSALDLIGISGVTLADTIGRYECTAIVAAREPLGDRNEHDIVSFQYTCRGVDGLLKEALVTAVSVSEWDGQKGTYLASLDLHHAPDGFAVGQVLEGTGSTVMEDGKAVGVDASGKTVFKFASGTLAALSGKTVKFTTKPAGFGRFELEFTDWREAEQLK